LVEFVDTAKNGATKQPYSCTLNCASRAARQSTQTCACGNGSYATCYSACGLTGKCRKGVNGIANDIAKFRSACAGTSIAGRYEFAATSKESSSFWGTYCGSGSLGSTRNSAKLPTELLTRAFKEAFNGHLTPQRRPLCIHDGAGSFL
jgi:hypothetical protein